MTNDQNSPSRKAAGTPSERSVSHSAGRTGSRAMRVPPSVQRRRNRLLWAKMMGAVALSIVAALVFALMVSPWLSNREAGEHLKTITSSRGSIAPVNTNLTTFTGTKIENVNVDQKALATTKDAASAPQGFLFSNGRGNAEKTVDVFVDFSNGRSRDFLIMNRANLQGMVEGGVINLRVIPVPTGNAYNVYSAEAIAESAYTSPEKTWDFMHELLRLGATVDTDKSKDILNMVVDTAKKYGVKDVDAASIKNGTFASWIVSASRDPRLKVGFYPPVVYVNDTLINPDKVNLNNPDDLRTIIQNTN